MLAQIILIFLVAFSGANCQLQSRGRTRDLDKDAIILRSESEDKDLQHGKFSYSFETSNGLEQRAEGHIKNPEADPDDQILSIVGSYSYIDANNNQVVVEYTADENGFKPREYIGGKGVRTQPPAPAPVPVAVPVPVQPQLRPVVVASAPRFGSRIQLARPIDSVVQQQIAATPSVVPQQRPIIIPQNQFARNHFFPAQFHQQIHPNQFGQQFV